MELDNIIKVVTTALLWSLCKFLPCLSSVYQVPTYAVFPAQT